MKFPEIPVYYLTVRNTDYSEDTPVNLSMIGPRIQQERKARGMTQSVLAEKVAVSTKYISNIECGEKLPRLETFIAIANALKTDANSLLVDVLDVSALIEASMMTGAVLAGASEKELEIVEQAAENIGLAFQIQDDILDVTSTQEELGKPIHSDEKNNKVTYVSLMGAPAAAGKVKELSEHAVELLNSLDRKNEFLDLLVESLVSRRK